MKKTLLKLRFMWFGTALCHWINRIHGSETIHFPSITDAKVKKVNETTAIVLVTKHTPKRLLGVCYGYHTEQTEFPIVSLAHEPSNERIYPNVLSHQERLDLIVGKKVMVGESIVVNGRQIPTFKIQ